MTREQAIQTAAQWWATLIVLQIWDNGDPESEAIHARFRDRMPVPQLTDKAALEGTLRDYFATLDWSPGTSIMDCYCDYAAAWLDTVLHTINPAWDSHFCGPQKAGTQFHIDVNGDVTVLAKRGYAKPWHALPASTESPSRGLPSSGGRGIEG